MFFGVSAVLIYLSLTRKIQFLKICEYLYYRQLDFPFNGLAETTKKNGSIFIKVMRYVHWIMILITLAIYFGYFGLFLIWAILGAIIDPNAFLPYASGAGTFLTFCTAKYNQFKKMFADGKKTLLTFLEGLFSGIFSEISKKLLVAINKAAETAVDKSKELLNSQAFQGVAGKFSDAGLIDKNALAEFQNKIDMLDPSKLAQAGVNAAQAIKDPMTMAKEVDKLLKELVFLYFN